MLRCYRALLLVPVVITAVSLPTSAPAKERIEIGCGVHISRVHPRRCLAAGVSGSAGWFVDLVDLRWVNWGELKARARGYVLNPDSHTRRAVKVLVYGRASCGGRTFYRDLRLGSRGHTVLRGRLMCPS